MSDVPPEVDLLVLGAGAGGMTAALTAAVLGLRVLLIEKTELVGGTSARSAGSVWVPNSRHSPPGEDSFEKALTYLQQAVGNRLDTDRATAFLRAAPEMVDFLEDNTAVRFRAYPYHPDYLATLEGATLRGRVLEPVPFDAAVLGPRFRDLRPPLPEFMLFGGMMVDRTDIGHLMGATRKISSFRHAIRLLARYGADRLRHRKRRAPRDGQCAGRAALSCASAAQRAGAAIDRGGVDHARRRTRQRRRRATRRRRRPRSAPGPGLCWRRAGSPVTRIFGGACCRRRWTTPRRWSRARPAMGCTSPSASAVISPSTTVTASGRPSRAVARADGSMAVFPHFVLDRGKPGALAIDPTGRRFVNEATPYHLFGEALFATLRRFPQGTCHLICDDAFIEKYGLGMVRPRRMNLRAASRTATS